MLNYEKRISKLKAMLNFSMLLRQFDIYIYINFAVLTKIND